ncbi:oligosaccharide flippase family protein [Spongiactinospora sp. TRM90649]|uniref:oligosaccharide flippase family protein n=1 Tax=Spongiactinospora sp. TRM90649 TaxID=3031114 RepID=UPI0023F8D83B|nr:oligosaccharide flippase family protein [Spongiactinospora sp. TRM90649]MDF5755010.1 oligosaccharide flippase family protein [Spongiactinospora sp. TRM90649]
MTDQRPDTGTGTTTEQETDDLSAIGRKAGRGLSWSLLGNVVMKAGSFAMSLVLARLLGEDDFGVFAIALAASQLMLHINDAGVIAAVVQWRGKLEEIAPTATVVAIASSLTLYGVFWTIAPVYAHFAGDQDAIGVMRVLMLTNVVYGLTAVRSAALMRRFEHGKLAWANLVGFLGNAALSISLAAGGAGAYSFSWGQLLQAVITGILVVLAARMRIRVRVEWDKAKRLLVFGLPLCVTLGIEGLLLNMDLLVVGGVVDKHTLGFYLMAFNIASWVPGLIGTAVRYVALPSFSRLAEDRTADSVSEGARRAIPLLMSVVLPVAVLMGVLATPLVTFLYGKPWAPAAEALSFLAVVMTIRMFSALTTDILAAVGRTRATMWLNLAWVALLVPALTIGARQAGIQGAAIAHACVGLVFALPVLCVVLHRTGVRLGPVAVGLIRPLAGGGAAAATMILLSGVLGDSDFVRLCVAGGGGFLVYGLVVVPRAVMVSAASKIGLRAALRKDSDA